MTKADVLAKLEEYKDRPVEIGLSDEGAVLHGNIDGHWLFEDGDNIVEVRVNSADGTYGFGVAMQQLSPFIITTVPFEIINYVKTYIKNVPGDIQNIVGELTPIGTDLTLDDIIKAMESNSIRKACSPRGNLNVDDVAPGTSYGAFQGSTISTDKDGIPPYMIQK